MVEISMRDAFVHGVENGEFRVSLSASRVKLLMSKLDENFENMQTESDCIKSCQSIYSANKKVFSAYKNVLLKYVSFAISQNKMSDAQLRLLANMKYEKIPVPDGDNEVYFMDFDSLKDAVEDTFLSADCVDRDLYLPAVAAIYLAWNGVSIDQMCKIKKSDVSYFNVTVDGEKIPLNRAAMRAVEAYADSSGYMRANGHNEYLVVYQESTYLFRTVYKSELIHRDITNMLIVFNGLNNRKYGLTFKKIYMSGALRRAYEYEKQEGKSVDIAKASVEQLSKIFGIPICGRSEARRVLQASFDAFKAQAKLG